MVESKTTKDNVAELKKYYDDIRDYGRGFYKQDGDKITHVPLADVYLENPDEQA